MKELICEAVSVATTLNGVKDCVIGVFEQVRNGNDSQRIGYVSGIITSGGREHVERNMQILAEYTERLRTENDFPVFSATDVFDDKVFARINAFSLPTHAWFVFWREILESGYVTNIFMTPRWMQSAGAIDEHETAKSLGIRVHYVESEK